MFHQLQTECYTGHIARSKRCSANGIHIEQKNKINASHISKLKVNVKVRNLVDGN